MTRESFKSAICVFSREVSGDLKNAFEKDDSKSWFQMSSVYQVAGRVLKTARFGLRLVGPFDQLGACRGWTGSRPWQVSYLRLAVLVGHWLRGGANVRPSHDPLMSDWHARHDELAPLGPGNAADHHWWMNFEDPAMHRLIYQVRQIKIYLFKRLRNEFKRLEHAWA